MKEFNAPRVPLKNPRAKKLLKVIDDNFGTLAWCKRWVDDLGVEGYQLGLKELVDCRIVGAYPPLCDRKGSYVAQYEHTIALKPSGKEIISKGDDY
jgi:methionyl aminopeptidase